jgi:thiol-disulfide isomerase/thioredoxin
MKKIIYFTAEWCGPCKMIKPQMKELATQLPITFIDVETSKSTADHYLVKSIPCAILIDEFGSERGRLVGNNINKNTVTELFNR